MSAPRLTFVLEAYGEDAAARAEQTLRSLTGTHPAIGVGILTDPLGLPHLTSLLGGRLAESPSAFNKSWHSVPALCLGFGDGLVRHADAMNAVIEPTWNDTDVYVPLVAGDLVSPTFSSRILDTFTTSLGSVGAVVTDYYENGLRVFEEPCARDRLLGRVWQPPSLAVARYAMESIGRYDPVVSPGETYDLLLRITSQFVVLHVPEPLFKAQPRYRPTETETTEAWRKAVWKASHAK